MKDRRKWACLLQLSSKRMFDQKSWRRAIDQLGAIGADWVIIDILDGVKFDSHPELAIEGTWEKAKFLEELAYIRSLGMTPIPKLNFSTTHDAWLGDYHRMVGTKPYYDVCRDLIVESYEMFGKPGFLHLGMDEESSSFSEDRDFVVVRQGDAWWHDLLFYIKVCDEIGARPMMWTSTVKTRGMERFYRTVPKNMVVCTGIYSYLDIPIDSTVEELLMSVDIAKHGYDIMPNGSNWACDTNMRDLANWTEAHVPDKSKIFGYMVSPWLPPLPVHERQIARAIDQLEDTMLQQGGKTPPKGERVAFAGWTNEVESGKMLRNVYPGDRRIVQETEELVYDFGDLEGMNLISEIKSFGKLKEETLSIVYGSKLDGSRIADPKPLAEYSVAYGSHRFVKEGFQFPKNARYIAYRMTRNMHFLWIVAKKV